MLETTASRLWERGGAHYGSPDKRPCAGWRRSGCRRAGGAVHDRHPDRHRRDPGRAAGRAARDPRPRRPLRPRPGSDRPELPREGRHADGRRRSRRWRRCSGRSRRRGSCSGRTWNIQAPPNLSFGSSRDCWTRASTTGAGLAGDDRPRQPGSPLAGGATAGAGDRRAGKGSSWRPGCRSIRSTSRGWSAGATRGRGGRAAACGRRGAGPRRALGGRRHRPPPPGPASFAAASVAWTPQIVTPRVPKAQQPVAEAPRQGRKARSSPRTMWRRSSGARPCACGRPPRRRRAAPRGVRRPSSLRRHAQHQLHERVLLPLRLLRVLEGQAGREPARRPYLVPTEEIVRRCREAWERGATEVCLQGGIHPAFTGAYYLDVCARDQAAAAGAAHPCLLGARGLAGRGHARRPARRLPRRAPRRRAGVAPGHGRGDPRRRGAP